MEEIGEMERLAFGDQRIFNMSKQKPRDIQIEGDTSKNFEKLQEALYKKFNYASLNKMRIPINGDSKSLRARVSTDEFSEIPIISSTASLTKTLRNSRNELKTPREIETTTTKNSSLKSLAKTLSKSRKPETKYFTFGGKAWSLVPTAKWKLLDKTEYNEEVNRETKIKNKHLSEQEQQKYVSLLNRNIRNRRPLSESCGSRMNKNSQEYTDIDSFFQNHVASKILNDPGEKDRPEEFDR